MPYIPHIRRARLQPQSIEAAQDKGELAFQLACVVDGYVAENGLSYDTITDIRGGLSGVEDEFNARFARPYEDVKMRDNGEVFGACKRIWQKIVADRYGAS